MARPWRVDDFDSVYNEFVCQDTIKFGTRAYYRRYRSRYKACIERFCSIAPPHPIDILDVGGGQLALVCKKLWNDRAVLADLPGPHTSYLAGHGVETVHWNLCKPEQPFGQVFDAVFFSEVIEHLPVPGHIALERLRQALKPGAFIICTTPNLYRARNVVYMILGLPIYDHFELPVEERSLGHVIEYSREHLQWQFEKAGFKACEVEYRQMRHSPTNRIFRLLSWLGQPLFVVPRFRDNLLATAYAPGDTTDQSSDDRAQLQLSSKSAGRARPLPY
jgi:SAM-dependent methyltransferase